jgi:hypothetical protein
VVFVAPAAGVAVLTPAEAAAVHAALSSAAAELRAAGDGHTEPETMRPASPCGHRANAERTVRI